jgi:RND family efflux transporter MFP subunit
MKEGSRQQDVLVAQSAVNSAQANLDNAQTNYDRAARLYKEGAIAQSEVDTTETQLKVAKANLASAQQQLSLKMEGNRPQEIVQAQEQVVTAQKNLDQANDNQRQIALKQADVDAAAAQVKQAKTAVTLALQTKDYAFIRSSVDGVVSQRMSEPGQMATIGSPLMKITVPGTVYFSASISETNVAEAHAGQSVMAQVDSYPNETFVGKIDRIYPTGDPSSRSFIARITLPDAGGKLKPGMFARGLILVSERHGVTLVPKTAITAAGGSVPIKNDSGNNETRSAVFEVKDGKAALKNITVGVPSGDDVEVISGLKPGDKVVISGSRLEEGQKVNVTH